MFIIESVERIFYTSSFSYQPLTSPAMPWGNRPDVLGERRHPLLCFGQTALGRKETRQARAVNEQWLLNKPLLVHGFSG